MKRPKPPAIILGIVCLAILAGIFWLWWSDYMLADACRDNGGSWNYEDRLCELDLGTVGKIVK